MAAAPVVSVVLPVKDAARTLVAALDSVLAQTFRAFEVIAVEDGSSDGSVRLLNEVAARDSRVRIVESDRRGLAAALNLGIARAQGRYIARQDADDLSLPERFARQVARLDGQPDLCAVGTAALTIDDAGHAIGGFPMRHGAAAVRAALRSARATPVHGAMMIRREAITLAGGYREAFVTSQDFDLWLRLSERCDIDNLTETLYHWRLSSTSVFGAQRQTQLMYAGVALAFAAERRRFGDDSYALLEGASGDLEAFAGEYRLSGLLRAYWGELLFRGTGDAGMARRHFALALRQGHIRPLTLLFWAWTRVRLPWIGGKPLAAPGQRRS